MNLARAIASHLVHPDARRDDHSPCRKCGCLSSDLTLAGTCPACIDLYEQVAEQTLALWHRAPISMEYSRALLDLEHAVGAECGFVSFAANEVRS